ncbi:hypothetical protein D3C77_762610 [compost metagenome]
MMTSSRREGSLGSRTATLVLESLLARRRRGTSAAETVLAGRALRALATSGAMVWRGTRPARFRTKRETALDMATSRR